VRYDLHIHTKYSKCSSLKPKDIIRIAKKRGLNGIAVCDHNTIKGALEVSRLNKDNAFEVIIGEEITTDKGEILGLYIKKEIKPGDFFRVISDIRKQNGIAIVAHPYVSIGLARKKADVNAVIKKVDAIEGINARSLFKFENKKAQAKAKKENISVTAGSDSHFKFEIGRAYTEFDGNLRDAIKNKKTRIYGNNRLAYVSGFRTVIWKYFLRFIL